MKFKRGDIAKITHPDMEGVRVKLLHKQPVGRYSLPDGHEAEGTEQGGWVFKFMDNWITVPIRNALGGKATRKTRYAACNERWLSPVAAAAAIQEAKEGV